MCDLFLWRDRLDAGFQSDGLVHQRQIQLGPENINGLQFIQFWPHCYWSICLFSIFGKNCQTPGDADWMSDLCQQSWLLLYAGNLSKVKEKMNFYLNENIIDLFIKWLVCKFLSFGKHFVWCSVHRIQIKSFTPSSTKRVRISICNAWDFSCIGSFFGYTNCNMAVQFYLNNISRYILWIF